SEGKGFWISGAGGFTSTVLDLIRWDAGLDAERLLPRSTWERAWTASILNEGTTVGTGLGWGTGTLLGRQKIGHLGGDRGFRSAFLRYREDRLTTILLANSDRVDQ